MDTSLPKTLPNTDVLGDVATYHCFDKCMQP